jgi:hypothetical protein
MATLTQSGQLSNRELAVENAYNDSQTGFITLLQEQINVAKIDLSDANNVLKSANIALTNLKNGLQSIQRAGVNTSGIAPIKNYYLGNKSITIPVIGNKNILAAIPDVLITIPNPVTTQQADAWINEKQAILDNINGAIKASFMNTVDVGYVNDSGVLVPTNTAAGRQSTWDLTFGATASQLQNAINEVKNRLASYNNSLVTTQASISSQMDIIEASQAVYTAAETRLKELNNQMAALRLQYQNDMAAAAEVTLQSAQTALQLQLANNPEYQAALAAERTAELNATTALQLDTLQAQADIEKAKIQAAADVEKAKVEAARAADVAEAAATGKTADQIAADKKLNTMLWVGASVLVVAILSFVAYKIWGND